MRRVVFCLAVLPALATVYGGALAADAAVEDAWSGRYAIEWVSGAAQQASQAGQRLVIERTSDADPSALVEKYRADLVRWRLGPGADDVPRPDAVKLRRFLPAEYREFGWIDLNAAGQMHCLDGGRLLICRTDPGRTVTFGPEGPRQERLVSRSGLFGIALHAGAFELNKE